MPGFAKVGVCGALVATSLLALAACAVQPPVSERSARAAANAEWRFVVSGDSRNCGDVVMPAIAAGARTNEAVFYWHLGDLRAIYTDDQDYRARHPDASREDYLQAAWPDFISEQIRPFSALPFYLGIGNHETLAPKSRTEFLSAFAEWLDTPELRQQRLLDDPQAFTPQAYFHWKRDGIAFVNLDNASDEQFDETQLRWLKARLEEAAIDPAIRAVVVGMHKALPESIARDHSMSDLAGSQASGIAAYQMLLALRGKKPVYVLASHSHYYMAGIYDTAYWRAHGGVLPGWIIGTAGAERYHLPRDLQGNTEHSAHSYGYLVVTVAPPGAVEPLRFRFVEVTPDDLPRATRERYGDALIRSCYNGNIKP